MKYPSFIAILLTSTSLIQGTFVCQQTVVGEVGEARFFQLSVEYREGVDRPGCKILLQVPSETVYTHKVIRLEKDCIVCMTDNPLSHALVPDTPETRQEWSKVTLFLLELLNAGLEYANHLTDTHTEEELSKVQLINNEFVFKVMNFLYSIDLLLDSGGYISEAQLNTFYQDILSAIDKIEQDEKQLSKPFIDIMYVPIRNWVKTRLPICNMYEYVRPQVRSGLSTVGYCFSQKNIFKSTFQKFRNIQKYKRLYLKQKPVILSIRQIGTALLKVHRIKRWNPL
jgi:hypothetical protein